MLQVALGGESLEIIDGISISLFFSLSLFLSFALSSHRVEVQEVIRSLLHHFIQERGVQSYKETLFSPLATRSEQGK